ncbi:MAG: hypothetical protein CNLJKLNK_00987 [Holosporales bacterium]
MTLYKPKKILTKATFMAMLCLSNIIVATERTELQRRDSFKKLEDLRAEKKEKAGEDVLYKKRDGELRPYGLMDDITEPGQSSQKIKETNDDLDFRLVDESLPQRVEYDPLTKKEEIELKKKIKEGRSDIQRHKDIVQNEYNKKRDAERRDTLSKMPQEYEQGAPDVDGRYRDEAEQGVRRHQEAVAVQERVSYQDFMKMNDDQIKKVREVVVPLSESYAHTYYNKNGNDLKPFDEKIQKNQDITVVLDCDGATKIDHNCLSSLYKMKKINIINADKVTSIGNNFLSSCFYLKTLDLYPLSNVKNIGSHFISSCSELTTLDLRPLSNVINIESSFLSYCSKLTTLDLSPLSNVKNIGDFFLNYCYKLTTLDLSPLSNVKNIGRFFLSSCHGLRTLDLRPLSNVESVQNDFLNFCGALTRETVKLPENWRFISVLPENLRPNKDASEREQSPQAMRAGSSPSRQELMQIVEEFTKKVNDSNEPSKYVQSVQPPQAREEVTQPLPRREEVTQPLPRREDDVQEQRRGNETVPARSRNSDAYFSAMLDVSSVSREPFMRLDDEKIKNVKEVKVPLKEAYSSSILDALNSKLRLNPDITVVLECGNESTIGDNCLAKLTQMRKLRIDAPNVSSIYDDFLNGCTGLTTLDLSPLVKVRSVGNQFLFGCKELTKLDLSPLFRLESIPDNFLYGCSGLKTLDLHPLSKLKAVRSGFLSECRGLTTLDLSPLSNVIRIHNEFLKGCKGLTTLDLSPLSQVQTIGQMFLADCVCLTTLNNINFSKVTSIGHFFLFRCGELTKFDLSSLKKGVRLASDFLSWCSPQQAEQANIPYEVRFSDVLNLAPQPQAFPRLSRETFTR